MKKLDGKEIDILIGTNLKRLRAELGKSQQDIGDMIELSNQQVSKFESGKNGLNANQLFMIAQGCDVDMNYFFK
jgi:transcriptional regulator with XRE-family HTH domain